MGLSYVHFFKTNSVVQACFSGDCRPTPIIRLPKSFVVIRGQSLCSPWEEVLLKRSPWFIFASAFPRHFVLIVGRLDDRVPPKLYTKEEVTLYRPLAVQRPVLQMIWSNKMNSWILSYFVAGTSRFRFFFRPLF
jgi:hypothetical protein